MSRTETTDDRRTAEAVQAIDKHTAAVGADDACASWARHHVLQGIAHGLHPAEAILSGMNEIDLWMQLHDRIDRQVAAQCVQHGANVVPIDRTVRDSGMEAEA